VEVFSSAWSVATLDMPAKVVIMSINYTWPRHNQNFQPADAASIIITTTITAAITIIAVADAAITNGKCETRKSTEIVIKNLIKNHYCTTTNIIKMFINFEQFISIFL
jgi:hypothetical protein